MKKLILYALVFAIPALSFAQSTENNVPAIKTDYLKKSKNQKTAAWVLLSGGFALSATGIVIATANASEDLSYGLGGFLVGEPAPQNSYTAESILLVTGTVAMLGSIPLFIASGKNKRKAMNITTSLKMEQATMLQNLSFVQRSYPAFVLKINL